MKNLTEVWTKSDLRNGDVFYNDIVNCLENYENKSPIQVEIKIFAIQIAKKLRQVILVAQEQDKFQIGCGDNVRFDGETLYLGYRLQQMIVKDNKINWPLILLRLSRVKTL